MKFNSVYIYSVAFSLFAKVAIAYPSDKPSICPSIKAIQAVQIYIQQDHHGRWFVDLGRNRFNTNDCWAFNTTFFVAKDKNDALKKAYSAMASLRFVSGPIKGSDDWFCNYQTQLGEAHAVTPTFYECWDIS